MKLDELRDKLRQAPDLASSKLERTAKRLECTECHELFRFDTRRTDGLRHLLCPPCALKEIARQLRVDK